MPEAEKTARVTMEWPVELKEKVRDKVGPRGLTPFTLEAVQRHFDYVYGKRSETPEAPAEAVEPEAPAATDAPDQAPSSEATVLEPATESSEAMTPVSPLPGDPVAEEDLTRADDFDEHAPMFTQAKKKDPEPTPDLPHDPQAPSKPPKRPDLFQKLQEQGKDLGIDLKPASEVLKPHPKEGEPQGTMAEEREKRGFPPSDMPTCPFHPEMAIGVNGECYKCTLENNGTDTTPKPPAPAVPATPEPAVNAADPVCTNCGSVLDDGECWECF